LPNVLIVEDSDFSRAQLEQQLLRLDQKPLLAKNGREAWELVQQHPINLIITDWIMPELDGAELCRHIRSAAFERYVYIILLTVKSRRNDMIEGIDAGADDFIVKPCTLSELRVKLLTGQRILDYEKSLLKQNQELALAHREISNGIRSAALFHRTLLPPTSCRLRDILFESRSMACEFATGDMFNYFALDGNRIVFYLLDVAGHGLPAAMLSFTLSHIISPLLGQAGRRKPIRQGRLNLSHPPELTARLNHMFQSPGEDGLSFTMVYGGVDLAAQQIHFTQAGHPPPVYLPCDGPARTVGDGGFPVGFFGEVEYDEYCIDFRPGDRLLLYSDGVTECRDGQKNIYSEDRLLGRLEATRNLSLTETMDNIKADLENWRGCPSFEDDWSLLGIEFGHPTDPTWPDETDPGGAG